MRHILCLAPSNRPALVISVSLGISGAYFVRNGAPGHGLLLFLSTLFVYRYVTLYKLFGVIFWCLPTVLLRFNFYPAARPSPQIPSTLHLGLSKQVDLHYAEIVTLNKVSKQCKQKHFSSIVFLTWSSSAELGEKFSTKAHFSRSIRYTQGEHRSPYEGLVCNNSRVWCPINSDTQMAISANM